MWLPIRLTVSAVRRIVHQLSKEFAPVCTWLWWPCGCWGRSWRQPGSVSQVMLQSTQAVPAGNLELGRQGILTAVPDSPVSSPLGQSPQLSIKWSTQWSVHQFCSDLCCNDWLLIFLYRSTVIHVYSLTQAGGVVYSNAPSNSSNSFIVIYLKSHNL